MCMMGNACSLGVLKKNKRWVRAGCQRAGSFYVGRIRGRIYAPERVDGGIVSGVMSD